MADAADESVSWGANMTKAHKTKNTEIAGALVKSESFKVERSLEEARLSLASWPMTYDFMGTQATRSVPGR
ncbi:hypothetical protein E4U59_000534 [Claviceps monticola]|nr:hypothetical protein E4U59_000534 [Claviceps monticola]